MKDVVHCALCILSSVTWLFSIESERTGSYGSNIIHTFIRESGFGQGVCEAALALQTVLTR